MARQPRNLGESTTQTALHGVHQSSMSCYVRFRDGESAPRLPLTRVGESAWERSRCDAGRAICPLPINSPAPVLQGRQNRLVKCIVPREVRVTACARSEASDEKILLFVARMGA
jgi:hypothetical protein